MPEHILKEHGKRRGVFNLPLLCLLNVLVLLCNRFTYPLVLRSLDRLVCFDTCFASVLVFAYVFFSLISRCSHAMDGIGRYCIALATLLVCCSVLSQFSDQ